MVNACMETLHELVKENPQVIVMGSDFMNVGEQFRGDADRYVEMGIAESNLVGAAAGMADCGMVPFVYAVAPFLAYRAYEFIRDDLCLQKRNVKLVAFSAGMDYSFMGPTHYTTEDIAILRVLPNLTLLSPASVKEVRMMIRAAVKISGPVYIRLGREKDREIHEEEYIFKLGKASVLREGNDVTVISTSTISWEVLQAAKKAADLGVSVRHLHMETLKPFDTEAILKAARETKRIITVEEHNIIGGLGGAVCEIVASAGIATPVIRMGLRDVFASGYGNHDEIKRLNGLGIEDIVREITKS